MDSTSLELDPSGDVRLILLRPNLQELRWSNDQSDSSLAGYHADIPESPFAAETPEDDEAPEVAEAPGDAEDASGPESPLDDEAALDPEPTVQCKPECESNEIRMLVSSRHLCLASSTFQKMLRGPFREGHSNGNGILEIETTEWDTEALLIVLNIIHGHHRFVPKSVNLELLVKIATIVDYYDCYEITAVFIDRWLPPLERNLPSSYGKECILWLFLSWAFLRVDTLQRMAEIIVMGCQEPVETMNLPIPFALLTMIEDKRRQTIEQIIMVLHSLRDSLCKEPGCNERCSALLLGSLMRQMEAAGITELSAKGAFEAFGGRSTDWWIELVSGFSSPEIRKHSYFCSCGCRLEKRIQSGLDERLESVRDLKLEHMWSQRMKEKEPHQG